MYPNLINTPKIYSGKNCVLDNANIFVTYGKKCLIVTSRTAGEKSGALADVIKALELNNIGYDIFNKITENPLVSTVIEGGRFARETGADFIIGIGGGSPLDASKAIAICAQNPQYDIDGLYNRKNPSKALPVILVGTTSGTGSEVTGVSVLTNDNTMQKKSIGGADCYGAVAFCDAKYTYSMSYDVTVTTALDAFAHAVEGFFSPRCTEYALMYAKMALNLGKPVFCEKPFTVTFEDTEELISLAKEKNLYLCEAMWTWFSPTANEVKKWIDENKAGKIASADFRYHIRTVQYKGRHTDPKRAGGALLDITIYPITYAYRLWGLPDKIESSATIKNGIDLNDSIVFTYKNGLKVNISASISDYLGLETMKIKGDKGTIKAPFFHAYNGVTFKSGFHKETFKGDGPKINSYIDEFNAVADDIRKGRKESSMVPLKATADVMKLLDNIREQIGLNYETE